MPAPSQPRVVIVGAGPVACLMAVELRRRSVTVDLYDRGDDIRHTRPTRRHSFNLTLTRRGLRCLDDAIVRALYRHGTTLTQRIVHHTDGGISRQPYGTGPEHHLLSIPRDLLHQILLDTAERAGARFHFGHECVAADPRRGEATFLVGDSHVLRTSGDLLVGCDGANSVVRQEMSRRGARMQIGQEYSRHGYLELTMPPSDTGGYRLREALRLDDLPEGQRDGLHVWPRGTFMLLAQPNVDSSYTTTLFMPLGPTAPGEPSFASITTGQQARDLFRRYLPDVSPLLPRVEQDFLATAPAALRTVKVFPYHHGRAVLVGDAAHTMVPFYGQGINCSFEDVRAFVDILDRHLVRSAPDLTEALAEFTAVRKAPGDTIAELSHGNLEDLTERIDDRSHLLRSALERRLHERHPDVFVPLYHMVAFTDVPYPQAVQRHEADRRILDQLCRRFDVATEAERIIEAYPTCRAEPGPTGPSSDLDLPAHQLADLLRTAADRVLSYRLDVARGAYPASYLREAVQVAEYPEGRRLSAALREDEPPAYGTDPTRLLDEIFDRAAPSGMVHTHPGFLSHVPSGGLIEAGVGEFVARALNRFGGVWAAAPGLVQLESNVIRWYCRMLGLPEGAFGYLTTGGSLATVMGLRCALEAAGVPPHRATVYVSDQGHFSVQKGARLVGLPAGGIRVVPSHPDGTIDVARLRDGITGDRRAGLAPVCVVATAGTTNTGAVDDLERVAAICRAEGVWLHTDACFGGFFRLTSRGRALLRGIEHSDSVAVDGHKSLFLPHGASALLVADQRRLRAAFEVPNAGYIPELTNHDEYVDFCNYGPELTREVRGLAAWMAIKTHGVKAFERCLDEKIDLADALANGLRQLPGMRVGTRSSPHLPTVTFGVTDGDAAQRESRNARICELVSSRGNVYLSTTSLPRDGLVLRACVMHHQTNKIVIDQLLTDLAWALGATRQETRCSTP